MAGETTFRTASTPVADTGTTTIQAKPRLYILPNQVDSNSPAGRVSYISWAGSYATKLLNSDWVIAARFSLV